MRRTKWRPTGKRLALAGLAAAWLAMLPARAAPDPFDLITAAEVQRDAAEPQPPRTRAMPMPAAPSGRSLVAPTIQVIAPDATGKPSTSPLRIEVAFKAPPDARIVPASFRLLYGVLKIDLTERVNKRATIRESGVVVDQARVPNGTHRLIVRIGDDKGRFGEQELLIRVGARP